jgi:hypothetical protein
VRTGSGRFVSPHGCGSFEVLDLWLEEAVKPKMRGEVALFRFADDFIACFEHKDDAERFQGALQRRLAKYGLSLSPEKTKLIEFGRKVLAVSERKGEKLDSFNFLGFTHCCARTRKGKFAVKVKTMSKRLRTADLKQHHSDRSGVSKSGVENIVAKMLDESVVYRIVEPDSTQEYVIADPLFRHYIYRYKLLLD